MTANFKIERSSSSGTEVVSVSGELDHATASELRTAIGGAIEAGEAGVVVDLKDCEFIDSTGLGLLVESRRKLEEAQRGFAVCCAREDVRRTLELTGIDAAVVLFENRAQALERIGRGEDGDDGA